MTGLLVAEIQQRVLVQYEAAQSLLQSDDIKQDPEIVHQYRVSLRRARSLLVLFEPFVSETKSLSRSLAQQASLANELRDLDVFLPLLPQGPVKHHLASRRQDALHEFLCRVEAMKRERELCLWGLNMPWETGTATFAEEVQLAVAKALTEVRERCEKAIRSDKSKHWHRLRLAIKRHRYLLNLCTEQKAPAWIKEWQDLLGTYNDLCCQVNILKSLEHNNPSLGDEARQLLKEWKATKNAHRARMKALAQLQLMKKEPSDSSEQINR